MNHGGTIFSSSLSGTNGLPQYQLAQLFDEVGNQLWEFQGWSPISAGSRSGNTFAVLSINEKESVATLCVWSKLKAAGRDDTAGSVLAPAWCHTMAGPVVLASGSGAAVAVSDDDSTVVAAVFMKTAQLPYAILYSFDAPTGHLEGSFQAASQPFPGVRLQVVIDDKGSTIVWSHYTSLYVLNRQAVVVWQRSLNFVNSAVCMSAGALWIAFGGFNTVYVLQRQNQTAAYADKWTYTPPGDLFASQCTISGANGNSTVSLDGIDTGVDDNTDPRFAFAVAWSGFQMTTKFVSLFPTIGLPQLGWTWNSATVMRVDRTTTLAFSHPNGAFLILASTGGPSKPTPGTLYFWNMAASSSLPFFTFAAEGSILAADGVDDCRGPLGNCSARIVAVGNTDPAYEWGGGGNIYAFNAYAGL